MAPIDLAEVTLSVVRVPVAGPSPNNTLVFVRGRLSGGTTASGPGGSLLQSSGYGLSAYQIDGFEQARAPDYLANTRWSVVGFLDFISSEDDQSFTAAIDSIQGHLSSDGAFYVTFDLASQISGDELDFGFTFCAYILVQEPQPDFTRPPRRGPSISDRVKLEKWSTIRERGLIRAISKEKAVGLVSPADQRRVVDHDCP
jgi:hypothetical protein